MRRNGLHADLVEKLRVDDELHRSIRVEDRAGTAATVPLEDRTILVVLHRADKRVVASGAGVKNSAVWDFWWVDDERIE